MCRVARCFGVVIVALLSVLAAGSGAMSQSYRFSLSLDSIVGAPGVRNVRLPVYLSNSIDTIAGVSLVFQVDRPGVCSLRTTIDTVGCRIGGWPVVSTTALAADGSALEVFSLYWVPPDQPAPLMLPTPDPRPLFRLLVDMFEEPASEPGAAITIATSPYDLFQLSDLRGNWLGHGWDTLADTTCLQCMQWDEGDPTLCLNWSVAGFGPCDSIVVHSQPIRVVDTSKVSINQNGWVELLPHPCGDFNLDTRANLTDLTLMVNFLFGSGTPQPARPGTMDVHRPCEGSLNLTDLTVLVGALFLGGPTMQCCSAGSQ